MPSQYFQVMCLLLSVSIRCFFSFVFIPKMGKQSSLTEVLRAQIVTLHGGGYTERDNSAKLRYSKTAVHNAIVKFNTDGTFRDSKRSGRPLRTKLRGDHAMRRIAMRSPMSACKKIRASLRLKGTEISLSTVSRRLSKEFGLKSRKPARTPRLTTVMKKRDWTLPDDIATGLSRSGRKCWSQMNRPYNSLYLARGSLSGQ